MAVWRLMTHHEDPERLFDWSLASGRIAIGWSEIGSLDQFRDEAEVSQTVQASYPNLKNRFVAGRQLWSFYSVMKSGDLVILKSGKRARVVEVSGPYSFDPAWKVQKLYGNQRSVKPTKLDPARLWQDAGEMKVGQNIRWTLIQGILDPRP